VHLADTEAPPGQDIDDRAHREIAQNQAACRYEIARLVCSIQIQMRTMHSREQRACLGSVVPAIGTPPLRCSRRAAHDDRRVNGQLYHPHAPRDPIMEMDMQLKTCSSPSVPPVEAPICGDKRAGPISPNSPFPLRRSFRARWGRWGRASSMSGAWANGLPRNHVISIAIGNHVISIAIGNHVISIAIGNHVISIPIGSRTGGSSLYAS